MGGTQSDGSVCPSHGGVPTRSGSRREHRAADVSQMHEAFLGGRKRTSPHSLWLLPEPGRATRDRAGLLPAVLPSSPQCSPSNPSSPQCSPSSSRPGWPSLTSKAEKGEKIFCLGLPFREVRNLRRWRGQQWLHYLDWSCAGTVRLRLSKLPLCLQPGPGEAKPKAQSECRGEQRAQIRRRPGKPRHESGPGRRGGDCRQSLALSGRLPPALAVSYITGLFSGNGRA